MKKGLLALVILALGLTLVPACQKREENEKTSTRRMKKTSRRTTKREHAPRMRRQPMEQQPANM